MITPNSLVRVKVDLVRPSKQISLDLASIFLRIYSRSSCPRLVWKEVALSLRQEEKQGKQPAQSSIAQDHKITQLIQGDYCRGKQGVAIHLM